MLEGPSNTASAIQRLKEDIDKLTEEQAKALKLAIHVGMTPNKAQEYDNRRAKILRYVQDLKTLEGRKS